MTTILYFGIPTIVILAFIYLYCTKPKFKARFHGYTPGTMSEGIKKYGESNVKTWWVKVLGNDGACMAYKRKR